MKFYDDVLSDDLITWINREREEFRYKQVWNCSELFWDDDIKTGVTGICSASHVSSDLHHAILEHIKSYLPEHDDLYIQHYIWFRGSGICMHDDGIYKFGATIYLNENWDMAYGGIFIWEDKDGYKAICPKKNMLALNHDHTQHMVTTVSDLSVEPRYTIQIWGK